MKKIIKTFAFWLVFIFSVGSLSYAKPMDMEELVDNFQGATDLQRGQILQDNLGKEISAGGTVGNVGEYDFFDVTNDIKGIYYQITTEQQKTKNNIPYQVIFLFKDRDKMQDINKGEAVSKDGKIIRVIDERLQIAVWLFCGELAEKDKALFK
jgi:hypothetical protein